jgi:hypothetical protein
MDTSTAETLMKAVLSLEGPLGEVYVAVSGIADPREKHLWIRKLGSLFRLHHEEFIRPIVRDFPDLDPDK